MKRWSDIVHKFAHIPDFKEVVLGVGIGYPDGKDLTSKYTSEQAPMKKLYT